MVVRDSGVLVGRDQFFLTRETTAFRFWLPIDQPIGLPDGFQHPITEEPSHEQQVQLHDAGYHVGVVWLVGSLCCRQVKVVRDHLEYRNMDAAFAAQRLSVPEPPKIDHERESREQSEMETTVSVVEVVTYGWSPDQDSDAFDNALDLVQHLQRQIRVATKQPLALTTREQLPPFIPMVSHPPDAEPGDWEVGSAAFLPNPNVHSIVPPVDIDALALENLHHFSNRGRSGLMPAEPLDLLLEAQFELSQNGNYRAATLAAASAAESMLDLLLAAMVWEEGQSPREAATILGGEKFLKRIRREFPKRLGGTWDSSTPGPIHDWEQSCHRLRHRVIHRGQRPGFDQATAAVMSVRELTRFITDRLVAKALDYPRVASKWVESERFGSEKIEKRIAELANAEANWDNMFEGWYASAMSLAWPDLTTPDLATAVLVVVVTGSDPVEGYWAAVDELNGLAAEVAPPAVSREQAASIRAFARACPGDLPTFVSVATNAEPKVIGEWVPVHELVPGIEPLHPRQIFLTSHPRQPRPL